MVEGFSRTYMTRERLALFPGPVATLHEFELLWWLRQLLPQERYEECHQVQQEILRREAAGRLRVAAIIELLRRDSPDGQPVLTGLGGLLDAWPARYPHLFNPPARNWWETCLN